MNAEQLFSIAKQVVADVRKSQILDEMSNLTNLLGQLASQPGDQNVQNSVAQSRVNLFKKLSNLENFVWPTGVQQTIAELGGEALLQNHIRNEIDKILQSEVLSPATARDQIQDISHRSHEFISTLDRLTEIFRELGIKEKNLEPWEAELGVLIPRPSIENKLGLLAKELDQVDKILKLASVVATGTQEEFELIYIASSDPSFFTSPSWKTAQLLGAIYVGIVTGINQTVELKKNIDGLITNGLSEDEVAGVKTVIEKQLNRRFEELTIELLDKFSAHKTEGDKNENSNRLRIVIDQLAPRIENGYDIQIRLGTLPEKDGEEEQGEEADDREEYRQLQSTASEMKRIEPSGRTVLSLPKPLDDKDLRDKGSKGKPATESE